MQVFTPPGKILIRLLTRIFPTNPLLPRCSPASRMIPARYTRVKYLPVMCGLSCPSLALTSTRQHRVASGAAPDGTGYTVGAGAAAHFPLYAVTVTRCMRVLLTPCARVALQHSKFECTRQLLCLQRSPAAGSYRRSRGE